jgi:hypothetical protein
MNLCRGCNHDFASVSAFDRHRIGAFEPGNYASLRNSRALRDAFRVAPMAEPIPRRTRVRDLFDTRARVLSSSRRLCGAIRALWRSRLSGKEPFRSEARMLRARSLSGRLAYLFARAVDHVAGSTYRLPIAYPARPFRLFDTRVSATAYPACTRRARVYELGLAPKSVPGDMPRLQCSCACVSRSRVDPARGRPPSPRSTEPLRV